MSKGWCITKTIDPFEIDGESYDRTGYGQVEYEAVMAEAEQIYARQIYVETDLKASDIENPVKFKTFSDDMELSFEGVISREWLDGEEPLAFAPLSFATADVGDTIMKYYEDGEWKHL